MSSVLPRWLKTCRCVLSCVIRKLEVRGEENTSEPTVFVTRHLNNYGPFAVYAFMPVEFRLWSYHVFMDAQAYYEHCSTFTFGKRLGLPPWAAKALAWGLKHPATWVYRQLGMIPVYRTGRDVIKTMEMSVDTISTGKNVLIMADVNYDQQGQDLGEMYSGFVYLGKLFYKKTGKCLTFTPVSVNRSESYLRIGQPVCFDPNACYALEKERIVCALRKELMDNHG